MTKADQLVKKQAIQREYEQAARRKREPKFPHGPGHASTGSIYDCNRKSFEKALRSYWDKLYVGWNPYKKDGQGCWEIWQQPSKKSRVLQYHNEETGVKIYTLEFKPNDFEHWVADLDYLSYDFIGKLRSMDAWENKHLIAQHDDEYEAHREKLERDEDDNIRQVVKENKRAFRDLLEYTQAGFNPLDFFTKK